MKFTSMIPAVFVTAILATPLTSRDGLTSESARLDTRAGQADKLCTLKTTASQGCDTDPYSEKRVRTVNSGDSFGVRCTSQARDVGGNKGWDYVPGWDCWISAAWTSQFCEGVCLIDPILKGVFALTVHRWCTCLLLSS